MSLSSENVPISNNAPENWDGVIQSIHPSLQAYMKMLAEKISLIEDFTPFYFDEEYSKQTGRFVDGIIKSEHGSIPNEMVQKLLSEGQKVHIENSVDTYRDDFYTQAVVNSVNEISKTFGSNVVLELLKKVDLPKDIIFSIDVSRERSHIRKIQILIYRVLDWCEAESVNFPLSIFLNGDFSKTKNQEIPSDEREDLTEMQNKAFQMATNIDETPVLFIQGGPGAGKTKVEVDIALEHIKEDRTVLLLSHSNKGAQVPAKALAKILGKKSQKYIHVAGNHTEKIDISLHRNRLRAGSPTYPTKKYQEINNMTDKEIKDTFLSDSYFPELGDIINARNGQKAEIYKKYDEKRDKHQQKIEKKLQKPGVTVSTFGSLLSDELLANTEFDVVIVDEATRMRNVELLQALEKAKKQIIFVGDPIQLGNIPLSRPDQESFMRQADSYHEDLLLEKFENGPFTEAIMSSSNPEEELPYVFLDKNFRSQPKIVKILSELMYDGKLKPGQENPSSEGIVKWYDTQSIDAKEKSSGTSKRNPGEAKFIGEKVLHLLLRKKNPVAPEDIGVISTYSEQAKLIRRYLKRKLYFSPGKTKNKDLYERIKANIATVDAFQGDERKVVFVSMTRSNDDGEIGFLNEERRMGVAIGRAQEELYLVGNAKTVKGNESEESREFFNKLHDLVEEHGEIQSVQSKKKK